MIVKAHIQKRMGAETFYFNVLWNSFIYGDSHPRNWAASCLQGSQALPLLLQTPLLLLQLLVAHAPAAVKAGANRLQPLAQDQRLHTR